MMKTLTDEDVVYQMSPANAPRLRVAPGESFRLATKDCYSNLLRTPSDRFTKDMWGKVNPATGPVFVEGAQPTDVLRVRVERIEIASRAAMCLEKGAGALPDHAQGVETTIMPIRDGMVRIAEGLDLPVRTMIGVLGVAPAGAAVTNSSPGPHGGNMDCKEIGEGARVYLPVEVAGALLAAGDLHALMGDGEVAICAAEVAGAVTLSADVLRGCILPTPAVETADKLLFLASAPTLDECETAVLDKAHRLLAEVLGMAANHALRVMSLTGDLGVCQVVDPLKTMKFALPKDVLSALDARGRLAEYLSSAR
jgi:amidase